MNLQTSFLKCSSPLHGTLGVRSNIFRGGEGVVDGEGSSSEGCLKWGGGGH